MTRFRLRDRVRREDGNRLKAIVERCGNFSAQEARFVSEIVSRLKTEGRRRSGYRMLVMEDTVPGAFVLFGPRSENPGEGDLYWIATDPSARGMGLGRSLLAEAEGRAAAEKIARLFIETEVGADYAAARRLYESAGYARAETVEDHYGPGRDQVIYVKSLI